MKSSHHRSGEHRAHLAGQHDHSPCVDCGTEHPTGSLWIYPHGYVCDACHHGHLLEEKERARHAPSIALFQLGIDLMRARAGIWTDEPPQA